MRITKQGQRQNQSTLCMARSAPPPPSSRSGGTRPRRRTAVTASRDPVISPWTRGGLSAEIPESRQCGCAPSPVFPPQLTVALITVAHRRCYRRLPLPSVTLISVAYCRRRTVKSAGLLRHVYRASEPHTLRRRMPTVPQRCIPTEGYLVWARQRSEWGSPPPLNRNFANRYAKNGVRGMSFCEKLQARLLPDVIHIICEDIVKSPTPTPTLPAGESSQSDSDSNPTHLKHSESDPGRTPARVGLQSSRTPTRSEFDPRLESDFPQANNCGTACQFAPKLHQTQGFSPTQSPRQHRESVRPDRIPTGSESDPVGIRPGRSPTPTKVGFRPKVGARPGRTLSDSDPAGNFD
eukprot:gene8791-biopygen1626